MAMARAAPSQANSVQVVSSTWARDSHDLFDFEAHSLHTQQFTIPRSMVFFRNGTEVMPLGEREAPPAGGDPLLRLVQRDGCFWVDRAAQSNSSKKLWLVVRELASAGHRLAEGDVMKLGRFKFRVRQLVASACGGQQPELRLDESSVFGACEKEPNTGADLSSTLCRICLLEGPGEDDPLITPCQCKGSIEYVHLGCLRHWIKGRLNLSDAQGGSYFYRPLACELCKAVYPTYVHNGKERAPLVEVPWTQPPFIVLENMVRDSQQHATRGLHVISLAAEKILKLGRGHESDVRIADVSISRFHAMIRFQRGHFVLEDNNSKFGTLVAMKKPRLLEPGSAISIQMGRTVLSLSAQSDPATGGQSAQMQQLPNSTAQDERNLRLSLLTRGTTNGSLAGMSMANSMTHTGSVDHQNNEAAS
mmetsp:Transcript_127303/g.249461  ORF Transcript_127303/g.249461 Transcript_127303/m.249461 type:complete len:419 (+) Transcript_127303:75-1331(+)